MPAFRSVSALSLTSRCQHRLLLVAGLVGCASGQLDKDSDGSQSGVPLGDMDLDEAEPAADAPVLLRATLRQEGATCFLEALYDDPQGPADVRRGTVWAVDPTTGAVWWTDDLLVCLDFACVGSFSDNHREYADAPCSRFGDYDLQALVFDRDGLDSNTEVVLRE